MSRIGKLPIAIPAGVTVEEKDRRVSIRGPKGALTIGLRPEVNVAVEGKLVVVSTTSVGDPRETRAYHGMTRALIGSAVLGVIKGYARALEVVGVGWNAAVQGDKLLLNVGFCNPVEVPIPKELKVETPKPTSIQVSGADKQAVGQFAARVRAVRPPEPYKGKGIRYTDEHVRRKAGKSFGS